MALRVKAVEAGDLDQVRICDLAVAGDERARAICGDVLAAAMARAEECGVGRAGNGVGVTICELPLGHPGRHVYSRDQTGRP